MAAVWRVEVSYQITGDALPAASTFANASEAPQTAVIFEARDDSSAATRWVAVIVRQEWVAGPAWQTAAVLKVGTNFATDDPLTGGTTLTTLTLADGGAGFRTGGTVAIEKDFDNDQLRFTTPAGTYSTSLSGLGIGINNTNALRGERLYFSSTIGTITPGTDLHQQANWRAFWTKQAGVKVRGASMTSVQPGSWSPAGDWSYVPLENNQVKTHTQTTTEDEIDLFFQNGVSNVAFRTRVQRTWTGGENVPLFARELDMTSALEHGLVWRAYSLSSEPDHLYVERTADEGVTWHQTVAQSGAALTGQPEIVLTPNIAWGEKALYVVWSDGANILQRHSLDYGENWEAILPIFVKAVGSTPRLPKFLIHPLGIQLYFWVEEETGKLFVRRSGSFGVTFTDAAPGNLIFTGVALEWLDAWVEADGEVRVAFKQLTGNAILYYSRDLGASWEADTGYLGPGTSVTGTRQRSAFDTGHGISYHTYFDTASTLVYGYASGSGGDLAMASLTPGSLSPVTTEHTPAIAMQSNHAPLVSYFFGETLFESYSVDFGQHWGFIFPP